MNPSAPPVLGMILKGYPRISETFISNEILRLEQLGFRIHIFSMRHPREHFSHDSVKQIQAPVSYLPQAIFSPQFTALMLYNARAAAARPAGYRAAARLAGRRWLRTRKSATLKHLLQAGYIVGRLLAKHPVAHLHAHFAHSPTSVAMFTHIISGIPFSFTGHAKDIYTSDPRQLREKIHLATFAATCTEYNRSYLAAIAGRATTPLHRVYHGIDIRLFTQSSTNRTETQPPWNILSIARIIPKKGLDTVYHALRLLKDRGLNFHHTLIGDGDDREQITHLISQLNLTDCVTLAGTLPHHQVLDHFRQSDLFVLGCRIAVTGDRDGIPNVCVESMAMGVPVVATHVSAIPELIQSEQHGLLVTPNNPPALARAMQRLLTDMDLRRRVIVAAQKRVIAHFDNQRLIEQMADLFKGVGISPRPAASPA